MGRAEIIERLEKLTGPSYAMEVAIAEFIGDPAWATMPPPNFTASLDAAVALVEKMLRPAHPGMTVNLKGIYSADRIYLSAEITWPSSERRGHGYTPSLALLLALFRSLPDTEER